MLTIQVDDKDVKRWLLAAGTQMPFAVMLGINRTAKLVKDEIREEMVRVFDRPTSYTLNSLLTTMATKHKLEGQVWLRDVWGSSGGTPAVNFIGPSIFGGGRHGKSHELALRRAGILGNDRVAVPGKDARLDQYGNISGGLIRQMMSGLLIGRETGYQSNITAASRARNKRRAVYFTMGKPAIGIFTRQGGVLRCFEKFVKAPVYQPRLDFFGIGQRVIDEHLQTETIIAIEEALRTAR
jgi:hypothetical protein